MNAVLSAHRRTLRWAIGALVVAMTTGCDYGPSDPQLNVPFSAVDLVVGTGTEATLGRRATVHYSGWVYSTTAAENKGTQFDTTSDDGQPFSFLLVNGTVIPGWLQGIPGMKVGGKRLLTLPPEYAYGSAGNGPNIPPYSTLIFEIELLNIE